MISDVFMEFPMFAHLYLTYRYINGLSMHSPYYSILGGVGHCFAWHVRVNLGFYFNFKIEEFVHSGLYAL